jgi:hypothetical protein
MAKGLRALQTVKTATETSWRRIMVGSPLRGMNGVSKFEALAPGLRPGCIGPYGLVMAFFGCQPGSAGIWVFSQFQYMAKK